ncbi:hypothetical protein [Kordiimonas pumila]|uniref:Cobalt transporter n=1 Tax=Kordiimonas pumila TaxID=2161677 RepID=A0ABV7D7G1_9PROT|nr:hypothetical protein [Kordiimonas pumila]
MRNMTKGITGIMVAGLFALSGAAIALDENVYYVYCHDENKQIGHDSHDEAEAQHEAELHAEETGHQTEVKHH